MRFTRTLGLSATLITTGIALFASLAGTSGAAEAGDPPPMSDSTIVATSFTVQKGKVGDALARCPAGARVVGGGVGQTRLMGTGSVQQSGPIGPSGATATTSTGDVATLWYASVSNTGPTGTYRVFAICSAKSDATIVARTPTVGARAWGSAVVPCDAPARAVGGGVGQTGATSPAFGHIGQSGPLDGTGSTANTVTGDQPTSWYGAVFRAGGSAREYRVFALCSAGAAHETANATVAATSFTVRPGRQGGATARCPAGKRATGGGVGQTGPIGGTFSIRQSGPLDESRRTATTDTGDVARAWYASVTTQRVARDFRVFAICVESS